MSNFKNSLTHKIIKERWSGKDMETYFHKAAEEFYQKLKKEMENKS